MTISTLTGVINGMLPCIPFSLAVTAGGGGNSNEAFYSLLNSPGAGSQNVEGTSFSFSPGVGGGTLTGTAGSGLSFGSASGSNSTYLARFEAQSYPGSLYLIDRLWMNSGLSVTSTTGQIVNSSTWPARDNNGTTSGTGVFLGLEVLTTLGNTSQITSGINITYTGYPSNSNNLTGVLDSTVPAFASAGTFIPFRLQNSTSDTGVASVQAFTTGTSFVSGSIALVAYRVLAVLPIPTNGVSNALDAFTGGMVKIYNGSYLGLLYKGYPVTSFNVSGHVIYSQG